MIERLTTGPMGVRLRAVLRRAPLIKELAQRVLLKHGSDAYEAKFHAALMETIGPGDVVWDVGANVGVYTALFAERVGDGGRVVAFEPSPGCRPALEEIRDRHGNVDIVGVALSDVNGSAAFDTSRGETSVNNQLGGSTGVEVTVARADSLTDLPRPDVVKIDVEGFEPEVLAGFDGMLASAPRSLMVEVHFGTLADRGMAHFPMDLPSTLREAGFRVRWVDPSHLAATR